MLGCHPALCAERERKREEGARERARAHPSPTRPSNSTCVASSPLSSTYICTPSPPSGSATVWSSGKLRWLRRSSAQLPAASTGGAGARGGGGGDVTTYVVGAPGGKASGYSGFSWGCRTP